jgi:microcystin degradation protein MlrC
VLVDLLARGRRLEKAYRQLPYLVPLTWQCSTLEPSRSIYAAAARLIDERVASTSYTPGFPASDIRDCGATVFAYGWDAQATQKAADALYRMVLEAEADYAGRLYSPDEAVREAMRRSQSASRPILLADTQDNPGAGGNGDTTGLLRSLIEQNAQDAVLGMLIDAPSAQRAHEVGQGNTSVFSLGGLSRIPGDRPLSGEFTVEQLGDGRFTCTGPMFKGFRMTLGPMALLRSRAAPGVRVVLASRKCQAADQEMFRHVGVEPRKKRIVALKSSVHFRADFEPIAKEVLVVKSPGPALADPAEFQWTKLRKGVRLRPLGPARA